MWKKLLRQTKGKLIPVKVKETEKENIHGQTVKYMKVIGKTILPMAKEHWKCLTEASTVEALKTGKKTVMEF